LRHLLGPLLALFGLMVIWGLSVPGIKLALREYPPLGLTALRYLAAAPCFVLLLRGRPVPSRRDLIMLAWLGVLGVDLGQIAQTVGVRHTSAAVATMLYATSPMFMVALSVPLLRQPVGPRHIAGLATAIAGVALVAWNNPAAPTTGASLFGVVLILLSSFTIAAYYVLSTALGRRYGAIATASWSCLFGTVPLLPIGAWDMWDAPIHPTPLGVAIVLYLALLVTVAGLWIWMHALRTVPARIAAAACYLQPLIGVGASAALFGDPLGGRFAIGALLILAGIVLTTLPSPTAAKPA
jgi:drug/metabolite transporter (DMT)-like permease